MKVVVNGESLRLEAGVRSVGELLAALGMPGEGTLVEQNGVALFPRELATTPVAAGDRFELVRIAAGG
ncbi:MAG: MoaD/ThiS family protein [Verrucomicrobiales bacterium]